MNTETKIVRSLTNGGETMKERMPDYPEEYDEPDGDIEYEDDEAAVFGSDGDHAMVYVGQCRCCGAWHANVVVDCESAHFVDTIAENIGPFASRAEAIEAGKTPAAEWCEVCGVRGDDWGIGEYDG